MENLYVKSGGVRYPIYVGRGAWRALRDIGRDTYTASFVLTERGLWSRWGRAFVRESGLETVRTIIVPQGEASKSLRMVDRVAGALSETGADRRSLLIAFGGGVIGDLGGFVASTYMRGIDCVQVPTTVVAQVDSAIGGKTAVNVGPTKNLVGTFFPPRLVLADPIVLSTLGERAFRSGLYEVVKHAILSGPGLFAELRECIDDLLPSRASTLGPLLARAAKVKVDVVRRDERESGLRRVLNLGHTYGHALEAATQYRRFLHGEAVGWGLLGVTRLAERMDLIKPRDAGRIEALVKRVSKLPPIRDLPPDRILNLLSRDKKAVGGKLHWVLPEGIGKVRISSDVPAIEIRAALCDVQKNRQDE